MNRLAYFSQTALRLQALEVLHEPGAVEPAITEVGEQVDEPGAADEAASDAHRVHAGLAGPVGQRRAVEDRRPDEAVAVSGQRCVMAQPAWQLP